MIIRMIVIIDDVNGRKACYIRVLALGVLSWPIIITFENFDVFLLQSL